MMVMEHIPQKLTPSFLEDLLTLYGYSDNQIFFFNAMGAGASVDHIHFQSVFHKDKLAIEYARVKNRGSLMALTGYPARAIVFDRNIDVRAMSDYIDRLQEGSIPFNILLVRDRVHLFVRRIKEVETIPGLPDNKIAAMELSGKFITTDHDVYDHFTKKSISEALGATTRTWEEIDSLFLNTELVPG